MGLSEREDIVYLDQHLQLIDGKVVVNDRIRRGMNRCREQF
jgi:hypothetical protein